MADKITNFEDYVKSQSKNKDEQTPPAPVKEEVTQETMDIQIEDPFKFLNEEEREEYILRRQHEQQPDDNDEEDDYAEDDEEEEPGRGPNMELVVRIASVMTGIVILAFIGLFLKVRVYDRYFAPDPDEAVNVATALPEGFTQRDDTVVVTGATSLNLRSGPGTDSTIATAVAEGTELKRIAVSDDDSWALIEYDGQQLYASMKYLKVQ